MNKVKKQKVITSKCNCKIKYIPINDCNTPEEIEEKLDQLAKILAQHVMDQINEEEAEKKLLDRPIYDIKLESKK